MSTRSSFRAAIGRQVPEKAAHRQPSGSPLRAVLEAEADMPRPVDIVRLLVERGLSLKRAHASLQDLAAGRPVALALPAPGDPVALRRDLQSLGVGLRAPRSPDAVDVQAVRARLGLTQDAFAIRFGFELDTVRNWEQGRNRPDAAARTLIALIDRHPEVVEEILAG